MRKPKHVAAHVALTALKELTVTFCALAGSTYTQVMSGHSLALLGGLLAICIGITAGQTTEGPIDDEVWIINSPEILIIPSENTNPTELGPIVDDFITVDIPENASSPPENIDPTGYSDPTLPYFPPYQTTGSCGEASLLCCPGRDDFCRRINCYCDEACYQSFHDCCSDYFPACQGGTAPPPGFGTADGPPFPFEDPVIGTAPPPGFGTADGPPFPFEDPVIDDVMSSTETTPPSTPLTSSTPLASGTLLTSGHPLPSGTPLTSDYAHWTVNFSQPECIPADQGRKFPVMCSGQRTNLVRHCDLYGCGCYRCPRGRKYLKGVDIVCRDGSTVYAPFTGTISNHGMCYGDDGDSPGSEGFTFIGSGFCFKIFNVKPDVHDGPVIKGCRLGTMLPMQEQYPRITSHIHIQKCDLSDPTGLL